MMNMKEEHELFNLELKYKIEDSGSKFQFSGFFI